MLPCCPEEHITPRIPRIIPLSNLTRNATERPCYAEAEYIEGESRGCMKHDQEKVNRSCTLGDQIN